MGSRSRWGRCSLRSRSWRVRCSVGSRSWERRGSVGSRFFGGRCSLDVAQVSVELVETLCPDPPVLLDPAHGRVECLPLKMAGTELGPAGPGDEPTAFEHLEVLGNRRKGHVEGRGQLVHRGVALRQAGHDRPAGRVRQGGESGVKLVHVPYFTTRLVSCQVKQTVLPMRLTSHLPKIITIHDLDLDVVLTAPGHDHGHGGVIVVVAGAVTRPGRLTWPPVGGSCSAEVAAAADGHHGEPLEPGSEQADRPVHALHPAVHEQGAGIDREPPVAFPD